MEHLDKLAALLPQLGNKVVFKDEDMQDFLEEVKSVMKGSAYGRTPSISPSQTSLTVRQLWYILNDITDVYNPDQFKPSSKMKMIFSSVCEHVLILLLKEAGANIEVPKSRIHVEFTTPKGNVVKMSGTDDYRIDGQIVDCKMPSEDVMKDKFKSVNALVEGDKFGYIPQAGCYSKGSGLPFMGWDICCTSTGKIKHISAETIDLDAGMLPFLNRYDEAVEAKEVPDCQFSTYWKYDRDTKTMIHTVFSFEGRQAYLEGSGGLIPWQCSRCPWRDTCWIEEIERIDKPNEVVRHKVGD